MNRLAQQRLVDAFITEVARHAQDDEKAPEVAGHKRPAEEAPDGEPEPKRAKSEQPPELQPSASDDAMPELVSFCHRCKKAAEAKPCAFCRACRTLRPCPGVEFSGWHITEPPGFTRVELFPPRVPCATGPRNTAVLVCGECVRCEACVLARNVFIVALRSDLEDQAIAAQESLSTAEHYIAQIKAAIRIESLATPASLL